MKKILSCYFISFMSVLYENSHPSSAHVLNTGALREADRRCLANRPNLIDWQHSLQSQNSPWWPQRSGFLDSLVSFVTLEHSDLSSRCLVSQSWKLSNAAVHRWAQISLVLWLVARLDVAALRIGTWQVKLVWWVNIRNRIFATHSCFRMLPKAPVVILNH